MMNKSGAIEMSIGTIVTIVLSMSMLILGMVLVKNIFSSSEDMTDMTVNQMKGEISGMFGENARLVTLPDTGEIDVDIGGKNSFGIGIRNLLKGAQVENMFEYKVVVDDSRIMEKCGVNEARAESWITIGDQGSLPVAPGEFEVVKVIIEIPDGTSICTFRYRIDVTANGVSYDTAAMIITTVG